MSAGDDTPRPTRDESVSADKANLLWAEGRLSIGTLAPAFLAVRSLLARQGLQVQGDGAGVAFLQAKGGHGWGRLLPIGVVAGREEVDHLCLGPLAGQAAGGDVGGVVGPALGLL